MVLPRAQCVPKTPGSCPQGYCLSAPCWNVVSTPRTQARCLLPPLYPHIVAGKQGVWSHPKYTRLADHPLSSLAALRVCGLVLFSVLQTLLRNAPRDPNFLLADSVFWQFPKLGHLLATRELVSQQVGG